MKNVLISGASFAGLCTAYWMNKLGYNVTVVEIGSSLKKGGTPVNILGDTIAIVRRMGLLDKIIGNKLAMQSMSYKNAADMTVRIDQGGNRADTEYEIERDVLLDMLYHLVKHTAGFVFGESITELKDVGDKIEVAFQKMPSATFDLVVGCDGIHSIVRKLWFGHETEYSLFLKTYFSITIVEKLLIPEFTTQIYNQPGKMVMLNAYNGKTDICLCYHAENEVPYNYRDEKQMRAMITDNFKDAGWRTQELLKEIEHCASFYFDKLCQMRMPSWGKGRVVLVGDAGYCPSPAAGRGGSVAIDGAAALADALEKYPDDLGRAFQLYDDSFRPFIEQLQQDVVEFGLDMLIPATEEAIHKRNMAGL